MLAKSTSRDSWKIALVPLPWCTSQSSTSTRSAPSASSAWRAATATFENRQKPIARARSAWWPGGRSAAEADPLAAAQQRLDERAGAAGGVQRRVPRARAQRRVGVERAAARAQLAHRLDVLARVHAPELLQLRARAPRGARSRASRARPRLCLDRADAVGALGVAEPVSCSSEDGWRKWSGTRAGTVPTPRGRPPPKRSCGPTSPWWAPAPPACSRRSWPPTQGARVALVCRSPLAADRELLGPGRHRRRAGRRRLARAATWPTPSPRAAAPPGRAPPACCARSRRRACASSSRSA